MTTQTLPFFSVVMPVYNGAKYFSSAVQSVLDQTNRDFQFIIVDGGSTDGTIEMIEAYAKKDPCIISLDQGSEPGVAAAMNVGVEASIGEWIVVMHADDIMMPRRLEVLFSCIQGLSENIGIIVSGVELIGDDDRMIGKSKPHLPNNPYFLTQENCDHVVGGLYHPTVKRSVMEKVNGYTLNCTCTEDVDLYNRVIESSHGIMIIDNYLMKYRIHSGSASTSKSRLLLMQWRFQKDLIRRRRAGESVLEWEEFLESRMKRNIFLRLNESRKDMGKVHYRNATSALSSRAWCRFLYSCAASLIMCPVFFLRKYRSRKVVI